MKSIGKKKQVLLEISYAFDRKNRKRNFILIITIAYSIIALFFLFSIVNGRVKADNVKKARENGNAATAVLENVSEIQYENLTKLNYVDELGIIRKFGLWYQDNKKIAACSTVSDIDFHTMYTPAYDNIVGSYPKKSTEIMLSVRLLSDLGVTEPELGMEIPVSIVPYDWMESGAETITMNCQLSGYYTDFTEDMEELPKAFFSKTFLQQQQFSALIDDALIKSDTLWINHVQMEQQLAIDIFLESEQNLFVINEGAAQTIRDMAGNYMFALLGLLLILLSVNLFTYNIFSISVTKDKRQYGLLKIVGTEPKHLKDIFTFSILRIILPGCALGIILGSLSVELVLPKIMSAMYSMESNTIKQMDFYSWKLLITAVLLGGIGTSFAFVRCIRSVMKLSPIECAKYEEKITTSRKSKKPARGAGIIDIAWRNFTRNRKKMFITIVSLFIGIEVFLLAVVISNGLDQTHKICRKPDFEIGVTKEAVEYYLRLNEGNSLENLKGHHLVSENLMTEIMNVAGINSDSIKKCIGSFGTFSHNSEAMQPRIASWKQDSEIITGLTLQVVSDEWIDALESYVNKKNYPTDIETLRDGKGFLLLHHHELSIHQSKAAEAAIGQKVSGILFEEQSNPFELINCGYLDCSDNGFPQLNMPWEGQNLNYMIISEKTMMTLKMNPVIYNISFDVTETNEEKAKHILQNILREANQKAEISNTYYLTASSDLLAKEESYIFAIRMVMGGFSGILILFAFVSYYNTLVTGYMTRYKELTIMRSIGMTVKQLRKMLVYEGVFYCIVTTAFLLTLGSVILLIAGTLLHNQIIYFTFQYPLRELVIALIPMFLISLFLPCILYTKKV